jgi:polysaccharide deacetylase 2 family uncharacterized protein YibQ
MAPSAGVFARVLNKLRRREARDAFMDDGDDVFVEDDFADEPPSRLGPKVALIASAAMFLGLAGFGVAVYLAGKDAAPPPSEMMMSLEQIEVDPDTPSAAVIQPQNTPDQVAATERSAARRPWLNAPPPPQATTSAPAAPTAATAAKAPPPAPASPPTAAAAPTKPAATQTATPAAPTAPTAKPPAPVSTAAAPPAPTAAAPAPAGTQKPAAPVGQASAPAPAPDVETTADTGMPSVVAAEAAPGAPDRFNAGGALNAAGRPRLSEPPLPPLERTALTAPPPRFANLGDLKPKVAAYTKTPDPAKAAAGRTGKVAVVVRNLGLSQSATEAAVSKLPPAVTLSFSPYAKNLRTWLERAKARGHEVLVEVPMESKTFPAEDPGPLGLMTSLESKENLQRLETILKTVPGAIGIDDTMGSKFRETEGPMGEVYGKLKERNLVYVQTQPGVRIGEPGVPNAVADVIADERPFRAAIDARLDYVERLAKFQGSAVTVLSPKPVSFERLALWLETLDKKGIALAPVSEVLVR